MIAWSKRQLKRWLLMRRYPHLQIAPDCEISGSQFGSDVRIGPRVTLINCEIADHSYVGPGTVICRTAIGKFCSVASDCSIGTGGHPAGTFVSSHPIFYLARPEQGWTLHDSDAFREFKPTTVGHDVWIGVKAIIRDGVTVGNGAIIGAGAVVVKDVEPYGIYAGVPARLIRFRFSSEDIAFLQSFQWWNRDRRWLEEHVKSFSDIRVFVAKHS